jgi:hypothetical protein
VSDLAGERARRNALFEPNAACAACGVRDTIVLNADARITLCGDCEAIARGIAPTEEHHIGVERYNPSLTVRVSINTHRRLTARQRSWIDRLKRLPVAKAREVGLARGFGNLFHEYADAIEEQHAAEKVLNERTAGNGSR